MGCVVVLLLLHGGVGQLLSVDDQVSVVRGLEGEAAVADAAAVASLLVLLHDVLQVLSALGKGQLETQGQGGWVSVWTTMDVLMTNCIFFLPLVSISQDPSRMQNPSLAAFFSFCVDFK